MQDTTAKIPWSYQTRRDCLLFYCMNVGSAKHSAWNVEQSSEM